MRPSFRRNRNSMLLLVLIIVSTSQSLCSAFLPPTRPSTIRASSNRNKLRSPLQQQQPSFSTVLLLSSSSSPPSGRGQGEYTATELQDMEDLIISLSEEPNDVSRRERVKDVFGEALSRPNGAPKRFSNLFDQVLMVVGDRVKSQAEQKAREQIQQQQEQPEAVSNDDDDTSAPAPEEEADDLSDMMGSTKTTEQKRLWALIDMMVQSKTIVKKASGELGSQGSFG